MARWLSGVEGGGSVGREAAPGHGIAPGPTRRTWDEVRRGVHGGHDGSRTREVVMAHLRGQEVEMARKKA
jgi:hypothetical protein